jgi:sec-independent protein translocase protein TatA
MGPLGVPELLIILLVVLLLFGSKKIPELARGMGKGIREFKDATKDPGPDQKELEDPDKK